MGNDSPISVPADPDEPEPEPVEPIADDVDADVDENQTLAAIATAAAEVDEERVHASVPAEIGVRVAARIIDWGIITLFIILAIMIEEVTPPETRHDLEQWLVCAVLGAVIAMCLAELTPRGSPGKRFWGIRLLTDQGYTPLLGRRVGRLLLRSGGTMLVALGLIVYVTGGPSWITWTVPVVTLAAVLQVIVMLIGWLWLAVSGRAVHDVLTRTVVGDVGTRLQRSRGFEVLARQRVEGVVFR